MDTIKSPVTGFSVSFPPILSKQPNLLILGTMPSVASLQAKEYYAHPANAFWKIIAAIKSMDCPADYEKKKRMLIDMDMALWDVCYSCIRPGSADSDISQVEPNKISELLTAYPTIKTIFFNGQMAARLFHRYLKPTEGIILKILPSTSPAYTLPFEQKLEAWRTNMQLFHFS